MNLPAGRHSEPSSVVEREVARAVELRRQLHAIPEIGHSEHLTSAAVRAACSGLDVSATTGTGLLVRIGPRTGPQVLLRAELDALPIEEATAIGWAATNGAMHACGHDVHLAGLVATIRILRTRAVLPLGLIAVFQPCEESYPSGAAQLLAAGTFDGVEVAAVASMHVHPDVPFGQVGLTPGPVNAAADEIRIRVRGRAGHAAYPHLSADPVAALAQVIVSLQQVLARRTDPMHPTVLSICTLRAGTVANVTPDEALASGILRCLHELDRPRLHDVIRTCVESTAVAFGCEGHLEIIEGEPALVNDPDLVAATVAALPAGVQRYEPAMRSCGADDLAEFGRLGPTLMGFVGLAGHRQFDPAPLHSPRFLPPDAAVGKVVSGSIAAYDGACSLQEG